MPTPASALAINFDAGVQSLERARIKMEGLFFSRQIDLEDIEIVYSGLYLAAFTSFENLLEELFFGILAHTFTSSLMMPKVAASSSDVVRQLLLIGGRSYLDWLPYKRTVERAEVVFPSGTPFTLLNKTQTASLEQYQLIRHAIAHKSDYAQKRFEREVIGSRTLLPRERTPAGFLRSKFRGSPPQTQYELIASELQGMVHIICQ